MSSRKAPPRRLPLNRERVVEAAVKLADESGIETLSMRYLALELGVVPMAIYKHVSNKEELLDEMIDAMVREIEPLLPDADWKSAMRHRILSARQALLRHPWAPHVIESRTHASPIVLDYMDSLIGIFLQAGFSTDLTHHAMHAIGSRMWGFIQEVFPTPSQPSDPATLAAMFAEYSVRYPHIMKMAEGASHDNASSLVAGCDDQFEFEFALDVLLDGFERLHKQGWSSTGPMRVNNPSLESVKRSKRRVDPK
ncbi:MAG TPA: TetR/AcrR family transcriptional regulator C-terminal domain-containing protein [Candidatus Nanopelagicaceae bacterium]